MCVCMCVCVCVCATEQVCVITASALHLEWHITTLSPWTMYFGCGVGCSASANASFAVGSFDELKTCLSIHIAMKLLDIGLANGSIKSLILAVASVTPVVSTCKYRTVLHEHPRHLAGPLL